MLGKQTAEGPDMSLTFRVARRVVIGVIGATIVLLGILLFFLPGPGIVVLAAGLAVLSVEFAWARHWLIKLRRGISGAARNARIKRTS